MDNITLTDIHKLLLKLDKKIDNLNNKINNNVFKKTDYKNVIRVNDNYHEYLTDKKIRKLLEAKSPSAEFRFFKLLYPKKLELPFKVISNKSFCYYDGNNWIDDNDGIMIKIFLNNVKKSYMKINKLENYSKTPQKFMDNQQHIFDLADETKIKKITALIYKEYK